MYSSSHPFLIPHFFCITVRLFSSLYSLTAPHDRSTDPPDSYHLYKNKRNRKSITAHRIVATAFIPNPNNYPDIDHIDGNPLNNNVHNLRWCNQVMNMNNPITRKRLSNSKTGKLDTKKSMPVVRIGNDGMIETFPSVMEAYRNGYNHSSILKCCKHKMHTHKGCKWMFLSDYENLTSKSKNDICQTSD